MTGNSARFVAGAGSEPNSAGTAEGKVSAVPAGQKMPDCCFPNTKEDIDYESEKTAEN